MKQTEIDLTHVPDCPHCGGPLVRVPGATRTIYICAVAAVQSKHVPLFSENLEKVTLKSRAAHVDEHH